MTAFGLLLQISGLTQREAASYLKLSTASIDKMARGTRATPPGVLDEMRNLIEMQDEAATRALETITDLDPPEVVLGYPADDHEADALGWPCVGAWRAMAARVIAALDVPVRLVPRGSTVDTARAADEHRR